MINKEPIDLNIQFNGNYYFFLWVLKEYKNELPYAGTIKQFALQNNYSFKVCDAWRSNGIGYKVWNLLHKDLTILFLRGKIRVANLLQLEEAWKAWKKGN